VNRVALARVFIFLLLASAGAVCQSEHSYTNSRQGDGSSLPEIESQQTHTWGWLPDAPPADGDRSASNGMNPITPGSQLSFVDITPISSRTFFDKYLYPSLLNRNARYRHATGGSLMRRVTNAASRLLIMRDESGNTRLNDSYLSGVLTSVVMQTASTPYWTRSALTPFSNLGSTMGSDAGLNVFHEFEPDIRQVIMAHTPRFVSRIENHISQDRRVWRSN
jgi:hypothetical protein